MSFLTEEENHVPEYIAVVASTGKVKIE